VLGSPGADDGDMLRLEFVVVNKVHLGWWRESGWRGQEYHSARGRSPAGQPIEPDALAVVVRVGVQEVVREAARVQLAVRRPDGGGHRRGPTHLAGQINGLVVVLLRTANHTIHEVECAMSRTWRQTAKTPSRCAMASETKTRLSINPSPVVSHASIWRPPRDAQEEFGKHL
jgi:hypothetical protein